MVIENLKLKNYRNYYDLDINFYNGLNIIIGENAQGKTNILESIYVLALTKSFLNVKDKYLIMDGMPYSKLQCLVSTNGMREKLEITLRCNDNKTLSIDDIEIKRYSNYISKIRVLLFGPNSVSMIRSGPSSRRKFLNVEISQISSLYVKKLQSYNVVLRQRNEFLKIVKSRGVVDKNYLDVINDKFCDLAVSVVLERERFISLVNEFIGDIYKEITGYDGLFLKYDSNAFVDGSNMVDSLKDELNSNLDREIFYGITLVGPHRDDFFFILDDKDLSLFGSQGQFRAAVLSLKLAEIHIFKDITGDNPILLLDDIFSEFDSNRKNRLINYILSDIQTIITTTDLDMIDSALVDKARVFNIESGNLAQLKKEGCINE